MEKEVEEQVFSEEFNDLIKKSGLTSREEYILIKRNSLAGEQRYSLDKLACYYGVDKTRIRQIEHNAMKKLQKVLKEHKYDLEVPHTDSYITHYLPEGESFSKSPKKKSLF